MTKSVSKSQENGEDKKAEQEKILQVKMKNCFGIKSLNHTFDFSKKNVIAIYARNGTGKSSFCRAFEERDLKDNITNEIGTIEVNPKFGNTPIVVSLPNEPIKNFGNNPFAFIKTKWSKVLRALQEPKNDFSILKELVKIIPLKGEDLKKWEAIKKDQRLKKIPYYSDSEPSRGLYRIILKRWGIIQRSKKKLPLRQLVLAYVDAEDRKEQKEQFLNMIENFKKDFSFPFTLDLKHLDSLCLENKRFKHNEVFQYLSRGEQIAFFFFKLYCRLHTEIAKNTLILLDDIADMFDSRNKLAMLSYLQKVIDEITNCYWIIFSHNYDFYRTLCSRLELPRENCLIATKEKDDNGDIIGMKIDENKYQKLKNPFRNWLEKAGTNGKEGVDIGDLCFLCLIPFVRQLIEFTKDINESSTQKDNELLTHLLHYFNEKDDTKEETEKITCAEVIKVFQKYADTCKDHRFNGTLTVWELLNKTCDKIIKGALELEHKLVLAMAIRLWAEKFMINQKCVLTEKSKSRTRELLRQYKEKYPEERKKIQTLHTVCVILPELIHCNAFHYEPLVDLDGIELVEYYKDIKGWISKGK